MRPFYAPGVPAVRGWNQSAYSPVQAAKYAIISDMLYSEAYGFAATRLPTPGAVLPEAGVAARLAQMDAGLAGEQRREKYTRAIQGADLLPLHRLSVAEQLHAYPQTGVPLIVTEPVPLKKGWER